MKNFISQYLEIPPELLNEKKTNESLNDTTKLKGILKKKNIPQMCNQNSTNEKINENPMQVNKWNKNNINHYNNKYNNNRTRKSKLRHTKRMQLKQSRCRELENWQKWSNVFACGQSRVSTLVRLAIITKTILEMAKAIITSVRIESIVRWLAGCRFIYLRYRLLPLFCWPACLLVVIVDNIACLFALFFV